MLGDIRSVVAATDLSTAADCTLEVAAHIARRVGARLHVVHAVGPSGGSALGIAGTGTKSSGSAALASAGTPAMQFEAQLARTIRDDEPFAPALIPGDSPAQAIGGHANDMEADLIVIGGPGAEQTVSGILGTLADKLLRSADAAVLVVREPRLLPPSRVMAAVPPAQPAGSIVEVALEWAARFGNRHADEAPVRVDAAHVLSNQGTGPLGFDRANILRPGDLGLGLAPEPRPCVELRELVLWGEDVARTLLEYARDAQPELLVVGSRGHGALKHALFGTTSSVLTSQAPCSVLLLPPRVWTA